MCTGSALFHTFGSTLGVQVGPKGAPREPKEPKRNPKTSPETPKKHQKIDLGPYLGTHGSQGCSRGTPGRENDTKIDYKTLVLHRPEA